MLNLDLPVNFDSPYQACSVNEFWKMAYFFDEIFLTKVYLYSAGRKQERKDKNLVQYIACFFMQRYLAWSKLDVRFMGRKFMGLQ